MVVVVVAVAVVVKSRQSWSKEEADTCGIFGQVQVGTYNKLKSVARKGRVKGSKQMVQRARESGRC